MKGYNTEIIKNALKECVLYSNGVAVEAKDEHEIRPAMWITLDGN